MAFTIKGNTISTTGGEEFPPLSSHRDAVRAAQEAVKRAEEIAKTEGRPRSSIAGMATNELGRVLLRSPLSFGAIVKIKSSVPDGDIIELIDPFYVELVGNLIRDPTFFHEIGPRKWEELIAASYDKAGFDKVILTPRSGDLGRDVIAIRSGFGSVRFVDQVKAYSPDHLVTAEEVRSLLGVLSADNEATKAILTTTSDFAPRIWETEQIQQFVPFRLELIGRKALLKRLADTIR